MFAPLLQHDKAHLLRYSLHSPTLCCKNTLSLSRRFHCHCLLLRQVHDGEELSNTGGYAMISIEWRVFCTIKCTHNILLHGSRSVSSYFSVPHIHHKITSVIYHTPYNARGHGQGIMCRWYVVNSSIRIEELVMLSMSTYLFIMLHVADLSCADEYHDDEYIFDYAC